MNLSRTTWLTIACIVLVLLGGFYFFIMANDSGDTVISAGAPASDAEASFITLVGQIGSVTFDTTLLSDPRFTALVDIRTNVIAEPQGRNDPFAPLGR